MWYISFLPLYLPTSPFLQSRRKGVAALALWIIAQVFHQGIDEVDGIGGLVMVWISVGDVGE